jgi:hypothetical protein
VSSSRKLQRRGQGSRVRAVLAQTQQALSSLQGARLDRLPEAIKQLEEQTKRAAQLADALADDYESLAEELEIQREVTLRLCAAVSEMPADSFFRQWRELESQARERVIEEREQENAKSVISKEA